MGTYANSLQKRFSNRGPNIGFCAICRTHGKLSRDHVPPQACGNMSDVVIRDVYGDSLNQQRNPIVSQGGLHFKTICEKCNSKLLGTEYDPALIRVVQDIQAYFTRASGSQLMLPRTHLFDYQPNLFLRSVLGHLLAANAVGDIATSTQAAPLDTSLREYVLNSSQMLPENIHVYYWLYPYRRQVIMKHCGMGFLGSAGDLIYGHVFKFRYYVAAAQSLNINHLQKSCPLWRLQIRSCHWRLTRLKRIMACALRRNRPIFSY